MVKNLSTITVATAEELSKANDGFFRLDGKISSSDTTLRALLDQEVNRKNEREVMARAAAMLRLGFSPV